MGLGQVTAADGGTWKLGDLVVNRLGFGAMRLPQTGRALVPDAVPRDRDQAIAVLRRAVELGVNHIDTAAFYFSPLRSANELINTALAPTRTTSSSSPRSGRAGTRPASGCPRPGPISCAGRSRRTCASSAATTWTW
jgi:hypothetical protein